MTNFDNIKNIDIENIDMSDYPDFCDAYAVYAEWEDGEPLTDDELDILNDNYWDVIYDEIIEQHLY